MTGRRRERAGEVGNSAGRGRICLPAALAVAAVLVSGTAWGAGLLTSNYQLAWDQKITFTGPVKADTRTVKHTLDTRYVGFLSPIVENEITLKVERESVSGAEPTLKLTPVVTLGYKGSYWNAGAKRTVEDTSEAGKTPKTTDAYFVEVFFSPPRPTLPDFKGKYTLDKDVQSGTSDTARHGLTLSSLYSPNEKLRFQGDYSRNLNKDNFTPDSDTEDEKISGLVGLRHFFSDKVRVNTEYKVEISKSATLLDAGGAKSAKDDQTHTWKNTLSFRPFEFTEIEASYDYDLKQNKITNEHFKTMNSKAALTQEIGPTLSLKGDFSRAVTEAVYTADDNRKTEDTWTTELKARFSKLLDITLKFQDKNTVEDHIDDAKDTTSGTINRTATWTGVLASFWKASASFDRTDTFAKERKTAIDTKYSLKTMLDFKTINLSVEPTYDITRKQDLQSTPVDDALTRDLKVKINYKLFSTQNMEAKVDHQYGRKTDTGAKNIQRTDSSNGNLSWNDPIPGWRFSVDLTRTATDTSEDPLPPDIASSAGFKADFQRDEAALSLSYKYDMKSTSDNSETFDAKVGWTAPLWDLSVTYSFNRTFSEVRNEGYSIGLAFKYNL